MAKAFKKAFPPSAVVGRYGGEEFMVVLPGRKLKAGLNFAEKLRLLVESQTYPGFDSLKVTISGGIVEFTGKSAGEMIKAADELLYFAKKNGRNQISASSGV